MSKEIKQKVENILQNNEKARNSDADLLILLYEKYYYMQDTISKERLRDILAYCNPYDVTRYRQKFNQDGLYLPTSEEVIKARRLKKEIMRESLGYPTIEKKREQMDWINN